MKNHDFKHLLHAVASAPALQRRGKLAPSENAGPINSDEETIEKTIPRRGTEQKPNSQPAAPTAPVGPAPDDLPFPPAEERAAPSGAATRAMVAPGPSVFQPKPLEDRQNTLAAPADYWSRMASAESQALAEEAAIGGELERLRTQARFAAVKVRGARGKLVLLTPQSPREMKLLLQALAMLREALGSAEQSEGGCAGEKDSRGDSGGTGTKGDGR